MKNEQPQSNNVPRIGFLGRLRAWFFTGLLVTVPLLLTVYITWWAIEVIDGQVARILPWIDQYVVGEIPGAGLILGVVLITFIGSIAAGFAGRWIIRLGESILDRMPVVRTIYGATKQILETVISTQSDAFREVVLVEYPRREMWVIGFLTGNTRGEVGDSVKAPMVNIFVPTTPNPTSGFLLFIPRKDVVFLKMSVEDAVKLVVSGGIVVPKTSSGGASAKQRALTTKNPSAKAARGKTAKRGVVKKRPAAKSASAKKSAKKRVAKKR